MMRRLRETATSRLCLSVLVCAGLPAVASAQMFVATGRHTLRQLPGVEVLVEPVPAELASAGVTADAVKKNVEAQLRGAGVPTFATQKENPSDAKAYLYVHLNLLPIPDAGVDAVAVQVQVRQTVRSLVTGSNIVDAVTWDSHTLVGAPAGDLRLVSAEIGEHVDRFIRDWRAVH